jgi:hypothetical protein
MSATEALIGLRVGKISTSMARWKRGAGRVDARVVGLHRERRRLDALLKVVQVDLGINGAARAEKRRLAGDDRLTHGDRCVRRREPHHARVDGVDHNRPVRCVKPHPVELAILIRWIESQAVAEVWENSSEVASWCGGVQGDEWNHDADPDGLAGFAGDILGWQSLDKPRIRVKMSETNAGCADQKPDTRATLAFSQ